MPTIIYFFIIFMFLPSPSFASYYPVKTDEGIYKKVIVKGLKGEKSKIYNKPDRRSNVDDRIEPMRFLFVLSYTGIFFRKDSSKKNGFYCVGYSPKEGDFAGWIHESEVVEWNQRETARFTRWVGRPPANLYENWKAVKEIVVKGHTREKPVSKEPPQPEPGQKFDWMLPILETKSIQFDNTLHRIFKLAYLEMPQYAFEQQKTMLSTKPETSSKDFTLDVVFVIDATRSMLPYIKRTKNAVERMGRKILSMKERGAIRLGLWVYRDRMINTGISIGRVTEKILSLDGGEDYYKFLDAIDKISVSDFSSGDHEEAVLEGLFRAIVDSKFSKDGLKSIILIGNASGHNGKHEKNPLELSISKIIDKASDKRIRISTLVLPGVCPKDYARFKQQAKALSNGIGPKTKGIFKTVPDVDSLEGMQSFEKNVYDLLAHESVLLDDYISVHLNPDKISSVRPEFRPIILVNLKHRNNMASGFEKNFSTGWIREKFDGKNIIRPQVLISENELDVYTLLLRYIGHWNNKQSAIQQLEFTQMRTLGAAIGENDLNSNQSISDVIEKKMGLPIKTRLLKLTKNEIMNMNDTKKRAFLKAIQLKIEILDKYKNDPEQWVRLSDDYAVTFVPIDELP